MSDFRDGEEFADVFESFSFSLYTIYVFCLFFHNIFFFHFINFPFLIRLHFLDNKLELNMKVLIIWNLTIDFHCKRIIMAIYLVFFSVAHCCFAVLFACVRFYKKKEFFYDGIHHRKEHQAIRTGLKITPFDKMLTWLK